MPPSPELLEQAARLRETLDMIVSHVAPLTRGPGAALPGDHARVDHALSAMRMAAWFLERGLHDGIDLTAMPQSRCLLFYGLEPALTHVREIVADSSEQPSWPVGLCHQAVETALDLLA